MKQTPLAAGLLALVLTTTLAACGEDAKDSTSDSSSGESAELEVLTEEQAEQALLSETVMGAEFAVAEPSEDSEEGAPGCLSALDDLDDIGAETKTEVEYDSTSEIGLPSVEHSVFSYTDIEPITARMEEVSAALDGCTSVDETSEDGTQYSLDVTLDTETTSDAADEQITLQAVGTIVSGEQEFPLGVYMSSVRVENHVSVVVFTDIPEDPDASAAAFDEYVVAGAERLAAVAAGEEPAEDPIAAPAT